MATVGETMSPFNYVGNQTSHLQQFFGSRLRAPLKSQDDDRVSRSEQEDTATPRLMTAPETYFSSFYVFV